MLQAIINKYLSMDPDIEMLLTPLYAKKIAIICYDFPKQNIYATFENNKILLSSSMPPSLDLTISSTLNGFIKLALTKDRSEIQLNGSIGLAESVQKLFVNLNIDWEEELSKYSGDIIAHQAMRCFKSLRDYTNGAFSNLQEMITEYLQEESQLLPTNYEIKKFMQEVDELRFAVDRLDAKVIAYENN